MKILKENIKNKIFYKCYLFFGEENYLKKYYEQKLKKALISDIAEVMNRDTFEGKNVSIETIIDSSETLPFMSEKRLVIVKSSELFQTGRKNDSEKMNEYIYSIPETTCIVFIEDNVDKRSKLYKKIQKEGHIVEFNSPKENELITWIQYNIKKYGNDIQPKTAVYMLRCVGTDMELLSNEMQKLLSYKNNGGFITEVDIDAICTKSLELKIFNMLDAIGNKNAEMAIEIYNNMIMLKEPAIKILAMIIRQFRLLYQSKYLIDEGNSVEIISKRLGQRSFVIKGLLSQVKNFSSELLRQALEDCLETDISIKTGTISGETAIELLIIKYSV